MHGWKRIRYNELGQDDGDNDEDDEDAKGGVDSSDGRGKFLIGLVKIQE